MHGTNIFYILIALTGFALVTCKSLHKREINRDTKVNVIGSVVEPNRLNLYRYLVELRFDCSHLCGGAIISARHVLTAAHCVTGKDPRELTITAGINTRFEANGEIRDVFAAIIHGGYSRGALLNDVAILTLQEPLDVTKYTVVKLPEVGEEFEGSIVDVAGWGYTNDLTYGYFTVEHNQICSGPSQMCITPFPGMATYPGDSGSPVVVRRGSNVILVGVVSGKIHTGPQTSNHVFAKISQLREWIDDAIGEGEQLFNIAERNLTNLPKNQCAAIDEAVRRVINV